MNAFKKSERERAILWWDIPKWEREKLRITRDCVITTFHFSWSLRFRVVTLPWYLFLTDYCETKQSEWKIKLKFPTLRQRWSFENNHGSSSIWSFKATLDFPNEPELAKAAAELSKLPNAATRHSSISIHKLSDNTYKWIRILQLALPAQLAKHSDVTLPNPKPVTDQDW